jgi:hypothetical protein
MAKRRSVSEIFAKAKGVLTVVVDGNEKTLTGGVKIKTLEGYKGTVKGTLPESLTPSTVKKFCEQQGNGTVITAPSVGGATPFKPLSGADVGELYEADYIDRMGEEISSGKPGKPGKPAADVPLA